GDLDVLGDLKIQGMGGSQTTISAGANPTDRVLDVPGGASLTLENLSITNGNLQDDPSNLRGGGIRFIGNATTTLLLDGTDVTNNLASNRTAHGYGGGIFAGGSAPTVTLQGGSDVTSNSAGQGATRPGDGGGIYVEGTNAHLNITNGNVQNNIAGGGVGAS